MILKQLIQTLILKKTSIQDRTIIGHVGSTSFSIKKTWVVMEMENYFFTNDDALAHA
jgi:hypothetical protein